MDTKELKRAPLYKPLAGSVYYLDVKPSKRQEQLKTHLRKLGAHLEDFLSKDVNYLVTDRLDGMPANAPELNPKFHPEVEPWFPDTPASGHPSPSPTFTKVISMEHEVQFPDSPVTDSFRTPTAVQPSVQSRGQALLERAVKHKVQKRGSADVLEVSRQWGIKILPIKQLLLTLEKLFRSSEAKTSFKKKSPQKKPGQKLYKLVHLQGPFIKIEDLKCEHRPFYRQLTSCPELFGDENKSIPKLKSEEVDKKGLKTPRFKSKKSVKIKEEETIGLAAKAKDNYNAKRQQEQKVTNQRTKLGYCEICSMSYTSLSKHMLVKTHATFMQNETNFEQLKELAKKLPTTKSLRQARPLSELNQGNEPSSHKPASVEPAAKCKRKRDEMSSSSPLFRKVNVVDKKNHTGCGGVDQLFTDSEGVEEEYVEPSCSTAGCGIQGCLGGSVCLSGPLFQEFPSPTIPLHIPPAHCNVQECCGSSPCSSLKSDHKKPTEAHQSSSSTVPFISLDIQPLNLCTKRKNASKNEKPTSCSPPKTYKRQSDHVFFSENACVSVLEEKENCGNAIPVANSIKPSANLNTILSFSNLTFPEDKIASQTQAKCVSATKNKPVVEHESVDVCSVRKVLFMSESNSPPKCQGTVENTAQPLFSSSDKTFSQRSFSEQMIDAMSSETEIEDLNS